MIHARIDTVDHRKIVGFETGTRALFDKNHAGDPYWIFLDAPQIKYRASFRDFLANPLTYKISTAGTLIKTTEPAIVIPDAQPDPPAGYDALIGRDGRYLTAPDGTFLLGYAPGYAPPPAGDVYLTDDDNFFVTDPDGNFLSEPV